MNKPQYKIHGKERRNLKKELSLLKLYVKNFWYYHQLDKDMSIIYSKCNNYPMDDDTAKDKYNKAKNKIKNIEQQLSTPY